MDEKLERQVTTAVTGSADVSSYTLSVFVVWLEACDNVPIIMTIIDHPCLLLWQVWHLMNVMQYELSFSSDLSETSQIR